MKAVYYNEWSFDGSKSGLFATKAVVVERCIKAARVEEMGNLLYLYSQGGYVITCIPKRDVIRIE